MVSLKRKLCLVLLVSLLGNYLYAQHYLQSNALDVAKSFFSDNKKSFGLSDNEIQLAVTRDYVDESINVRHIYLQQQLNGLDVVNGNAAIHLKKDGSVFHHIEQLQRIKTVPGLSSALDSKTSLQKAMQEIGMSLPGDLAVKTPAKGSSEITIYKAAGTSADIPVRKVFITNSNNDLRLAWEIQLFRRDKDNYWIIYIDATNGKVLAKQDMIVKCSFGNNYVTDEPGEAINHQKHGHYLAPVHEVNSGFNAGVPLNTRIDFLNTGIDKEQRLTLAVSNQYRVYDTAAESPNSVGATHALVSKAGDPLASPDGWHKVSNGVAFPYTRGNNAWAFQDPSPGPLGGAPSDLPDRSAYNNGGVAGTPVLTEPFTFDYAANLANEPETYQKAAIVNLFYWNNLMHDVFYHFGFTEASGNFQQSHDFSTGTNRGNKPTGQNDAVWAQAQDGGGTNNANFLTLADGINGQMQMYLWTGSPPDSMVKVTYSENGNPPVGSRYYAIQGSFGNAAANNTDLYANPVLDKPFVIVKKNPAGVGTETQGCGTGQQSVALPPSNDVSGKIVLIDRGGCSFVEKMVGAQMGGAAGVIIINNVPGAQPIVMGGSDAPNNVVTIPGVMVSYEVGKFLKTRIVLGDSLKGELKKTFNTPKRDGDFDNAVIAHEYGHGISTRLTAGGPNPTSRLGGDEQGGEGWSDNFGLYMTTRRKDLLPATALHPNGILPTRGIGTYVTYQPLTGGGIRPTPYSIDMSINPSTYKRVGEGGEITIPHGVGYIWASMLYELQQEMIDQYGFKDSVDKADPVGGLTPPLAGGNNIAMRLVMEGLKLQPASPTFVQQRDAILKADTMLYGGTQNGCRIWKAFAKRGLGYSAKSNTNAVGDEEEQFNTHPDCFAQTVLKITHTGPSVILNQSEQDYTIKVINISPITLSANNLSISDTLPEHSTLISAPGGTLNGNVVTWPLATLAKGDTITKTVRIAVTHPTPATLVFSEDNENTTATNKFQTLPQGNGFWNLISSNAYSGTKTWYVEDYDLGGSNTTLTQKVGMVIPAGASLIFNHKFATESTWDGGIVEYTIDGATWVYLNSFTKNGYNGVISHIDNPQIGTAPTAAFTGASPGYIQSIASLSALAGQNVRFRFRFTSDPGGGSVDGGGWWVDDVMIASPASFISARAASEAANSANKVTAEASALVITLGPLPVTGVELRAAVRNRQIILNWETQTEINNRGFEVLRKAVNENGYSVVGFVNGAGNSNSVVPYSFIDQSALKGVRYEYKLRIVSIDNSSRMSNIASAMIIDKVFAFSFIPNPATDVITITVNNDSKMAAEFRLTDLSGKVLKRESLGDNSYINKQVSLKGIAKGMYLVEVTNGIEKQVEKLIVQ